MPTYDSTFHPYGQIMMRNVDDSNKTEFTNGLWEIQRLGISSVRVVEDGYDEWTSIEGFAVRSVRSAVRLHGALEAFEANDWRST